MNRQLLGFLTVVAAVAAVLVLRLGGDSNQAVGEELLPDLWTSAPFQLTLSELEGRTVLRFTSEMNNQGAGDLLLRGEPTTSDVEQLIELSESGHSAVSLDVQVVWGGDTHNHWHIEDVARYWVANLEGAPIGDAYDNKVGFCIFDSVDFQSGLPRAPDSVRHRIGGCGTRLSPEISMGLSVGWGDQYRFDLNGQYIDIEDLEPGRYLLMAEVDPGGRLRELDKTNNTAATPFTLEVRDGRLVIVTG